MHLTHTYRPLLFAGLLLAVPVLTGAGGKGCGVGEVVIGEAGGAPPDATSSSTTSSGATPSSTTSSGATSSSTTSSGATSSSTTSSSSGGTACPDGITVVASSTAQIE